MDDRWNTRPPILAYRSRDCHEAAGIAIFGADLENLGSVFVEHIGRERHEVRAGEAGVELGIDRDVGWRGEDRAGAKRARPELHGAFVNRPNQTLGQEVYGESGRVAR